MFGGMRFDMDTEIFKKPTTWAVIVPCVAFVLAIACTYNMFAERSEAKRVEDTSKDVFDSARYIMSMRNVVGQNAEVETLRVFNGIESARECAAAAAIPESKFPRGESSNPQQQNDGSFLRRDTYRLEQIRLMQIAFFVDYAERNYKDLVCTGLAIIKSHSRTRERDSWDLVANIQYSADN